VKAIDAMLVWTSDRAPFERARSKGKVAVVTIPEPPATRELMCSVGACSLDWTEANDAGRKELMQGYVTEMIHHDNIPEAAVRQEISKIDEYSNFPFSTAKPEPEDE